MRAKIDETTGISPTSLCGHRTVTKTLYSPPDCPKILLIFKRVQRELDERYFSATDEERSQKAITGLYDLTEILSEARGQGDLDALRIYGDFPIFDNVGVHLALDDLRDAFQTSTIYGLVRQSHLDTHLRARLLFDDTALSYAEPAFSEAWSRLCRFIFRERFNDAEAIIKIMDMRHIICPDEIAGILDAGESGSPSLTDGVL